MIINPTSFTYEHLSTLKFKELQKLSVQFRVNKRWAKKQELIENLLALKNDCSENVGEKNTEEKEWKDGSLVFNDRNTNEIKDDDTNKRLTFNIATKSDSRLTFDIPQNGKSLVSIKENNIDPRLTYDIPPSKEEFGVNPEVDSRATYEVAPKGQLLEARATFDIPQNGKILLDEVSIDSKMTSNKKTSDDVKEVFELSKKNVEDKKNDQSLSQVKMLTIPYARVGKRTKKDKEGGKNNSSPLKLSKKSINIKKTVRQPTSRLDLIKSPAFSSIKKSATKTAPTIPQSLTKTQQTKNVPSKIPTRLQFNDEKSTRSKVVFSDETDKENVKRILRRKSRTADEVLIKKPNSVSFMSPPVSLKKNSKVCMPLKKTPIRREAESKTSSKKVNAVSTPNLKPTLPTKPITATKMPDFHKIHQKQFEQMDSLQDYLKKKEERTRRLFGTPKQGTQSKGLNKSMPVFEFQSSVKSESKAGKRGELRMGTATPMMTMKKKDAIGKEAFKSKLPPTKLQTDIKDKNRSHIHGVRTNKRFELQMKFRNM